MIPSVPTHTSLSTQFHARLNTIIHCAHRIFENSHKNTTEFDGSLNLSDPTVALAAISIFASPSVTKCERHHSLPLIDPYPYPHYHIDPHHLLNPNPQPSRYPLSLVSPHVTPSPWYLLHSQTGDIATMAANRRSHPSQLS